MARRAGCHKPAAGRERQACGLLAWFRRAMLFAMNLEPTRPPDESWPLAVYTDFVCPYSYIGEALLARLQRERGIEVVYRPFELWPAPSVRPDPPGRGDTDARVNWEQKVIPAAEEWGVDIARPATLPRTRKAHEAAAFAREHAAETRFRAAVFHAYFVDGADIGRIDVLVGLSEEIGLDPMDARLALDLDSRTEQVVEAEREAVSTGVRGVPSYRSGDRLLVGLHSYRDVVELIDSPEAS